MSTDTDLAKDNAAQKLQAELQTFTHKLNNWQAQVGVYNQQVQTENTRFQGEIQSASTQMTDEMNRFNTRFQAFQAKIGAWEKMIGQLRQDYVTALGLPPTQSQKQGE